MDEEYQKELSKAKQNFYKKKIKNLSKIKSSHWYRELKKLTCFDQFKSEDVTVEDIKDLPMNEQAELIADKFAAVSQEYEAVKTEDIEIPEFCEADIPKVSVEDVKVALAQMDSNKSNVQNDVPAKVLKYVADQLAKPVADVINSSIRQGIWPDVLKLEIVTPVPKVFPPKSIEELRNISGLLNLDKISEKNNFQNDDRRYEEES